MQSHQTSPQSALPYRREVVVSETVTLLLPPPKTPLLTAPAPVDVTDDDFEALVRRALHTAGGTLLFRVRVAERNGEVHVAAAAVGTGGARQFLLLSLPVTGGRLSIEAASHSTSPLAGIAASYARLLDIFHAAA